MNRTTRTLILLALVAVASRVDAARMPHTHLLFSNVKNVNGFDSGFVIANTSMDPLGTTPEDGSCTVTFFGTHAGSPFTTPTIKAGSTFAFLLSIVQPGFEGYAFADCTFDHPHGLAFVSDVGTRNLIAADEALVVPASKKRPASGERLLH